MKKSGKKVSKAKLRIIISVCVMLVFLIALIITNIFVPVKYLFSYFVLRNKGADDGILRVSFLDVGYGDCIVIELPDGKNMLIDAGNGRFPLQAKILKYLNGRNIDSIDYLVCSSVNSEHCGGLEEIIKYKDVKKIYMPYCKNVNINRSYRRFYDEAKASGAEIAISEYGEGEDCGDYFFKFLSPSVHSLPNGEYADLNMNATEKSVGNASAVIWLEFGDTSFLFTGDIRFEILQNILASYELIPEDYPVKLKNLDVMQIPAHGSVNSSCQEFYDFTKPPVAVTSVGENGFGCPSQQIVHQAGKWAQDNFFRTDDGDVIIEADICGYKILQ